MRAIARDSSADSGAIDFLLQNNGGVPGLASLLALPALPAAAQGAWAVSHLAKRGPAQRKALAAAGCLLPLLALLAHPSAALAQAAALALGQLSADRDISHQIIAAGGLPAASAAAQRGEARALQCR